MNRRSLVPLLALLVSTVAADAAWAQLEYGTTGFEKELLASDGADQDQFGDDVAVLGDLVVVGAPRKSVGASSDGQVYVFERNLGGAANWGQLYKLASPVAVDAESFGASVALSGSTLVVGAPGNGGWAPGDLGGIVYFRDALTGASLGSFVSPLASTYSLVGRAVAIDGASAIMGADYRLFTPFYQSFIGAAFITDTSGILQHTLIASDAASGANFGTSVAIQGGLCAVGAPNADGATFNAGAVYLFDVATGAQLHKLFAPAGAIGQEFGKSVALDGGKLLVGAPNHFLGSGLSGKVYVFDAASGVLLSELLPPGAAFRFGDDLALSDGYAYIGDAYGVSSYSGQLWQYDLGYASPTCAYRDLSLPKMIGFADSVAADGTTLVSGSPLTSPPVQARGAAHIMERLDLGLGNNLDLLFAAQDQATLKLHGGLAGAPGAFILTGVNGAPTFSVLVYGAFDATGKWSVTFPSIPSLAGLTLELTGGGLAQTGAIAFSNTRELQFL